VRSRGSRRSRHCQAFDSRGRLLAPDRPEPRRVSFTTSLRGAGANPSRRARMPPALRAYQYNLLAYKRTWRDRSPRRSLSGALPRRDRRSLGHLIDHGSNQAVGGVPYLWFLAPGLLAGRPCRSGERVDVSGDGGDQVAEDLLRDARHAARSDRRPLWPPAVDLDSCRPGLGRLPRRDERRSTRCLRCGRWRRSRPQS